MKTWTSLTIAVSLGVLGCSAAFAQAPAAGVLETLGAAKAAFEKTCSRCHGLERPNGKTFDKAGWEGVVERMKGNGASVSAQEKAQVVSWLLAKNTFEAKCSACHGTDRPLGKNKSAKDWLATVERMSGKKPGHLDAAAVADIAAYLGLVRPLP